MGEMTAIRDAYGAALKELGEQDVRIVGLEADVASSTKSGIFGSAFPERYFNVGISELNMVAMAAGLARTGSGVLRGQYEVCDWKGHPRQGGE